MMEVMYFPYSYLINVHFPYSGKNNLKGIYMYICNLRELG